MRAPSALRKALMCSPPRPLKPTTATRTSLLDPATCAQERAGRPKAAAVSAVDLRNVRRVRFFIIELSSGRKRTSIYLKMDGLFYSTATGLKPQKLLARRAGLV